MNCKIICTRTQKPLQKVLSRCCAALFVMGLLFISGIFNAHTVLNVQAETTPMTLGANDTDDLKNNIITSTGYGDVTFLNYLGLSAQKLANNNDLYASVMIAQALLESGWGTSSLAQAPNYNLFGVKGTYQGQSVKLSTQEDDGSGNLYAINSGFRRYPSYKESLEDYVRVLRSNEQLYGPTWRSNAKNYQDATKALTGHYASDTNYDQKLNDMIEKYNLTRFDQFTGADNQPSANDIVVNQVSLLVNQTQTSAFAKNAYQKEQAPVIILDHYNHPVSAQQPQETSIMPKPAYDALSMAINFNKEITQTSVVPKAPLVKDYSSLGKKQDVIVVKKDKDTDDSSSKSEPSVNVNKDSYESQKQTEDQKNSDTVLK